MEVGRLYRLKKGTYMQDKQHRDFYKHDTDYKIDFISFYDVYFQGHCSVDLQYFEYHFELSPIELRKDKLNKLIWK